MADKQIIGVNNFKSGIKINDSSTLSSVSTGTSDNDKIATKGYVDDNSGGGVSIFECTVGASGADYTTLRAAITAGKTRILVIDDTTETGNITLPSNCLIQGIGMNAVSIDMATYNITTEDDNIFREVKIKSSVDGNAIIVGGDRNRFVNSYLEWTHTSNPISASHFITDNNVAITDLVIENCECKFGGNFVNEEYFIFIDNTSSNPTKINGINFISSDSNNGIMRSDSGDVIASNIFVSGSSRTSSFIVGEDSVINNSNNLNILTKSNITINNTSVTTLVMSGSIVKISNCYIGTITDSSSGEFYISGSRIYGAITLSNENILLSNCEINNNLTLSSGADICQICNCFIQGAVSITGNDNTLTGCRVGADAGGGSNTITVNSGANRTIISGCRTDAAIVDNGTDTATGTNVVY